MTRHTRNSLGTADPADLHLDDDDTQSPLSSGLRPYSFDPRPGQTDPQHNSSLESKSTPSLSPKNPIPQHTEHWRTDQTTIPSEYDDQQEGSYADEQDEEVLEAGGILMDIYHESTAILSERMDTNVWSSPTIESNSGGMTAKRSSFVSQSSNSSSKRSHEDAFPASRAKTITDNDCAYFNNPVLEAINNSPPKRRLRSTALNPTLGLEEDAEYADDEDVGDQTEVEESASSDDEESGGVELPQPGSPSMRYMTYAGDSDEEEESRRWDRSNVGLAYNQFHPPASFTTSACNLLKYPSHLSPTAKTWISPRRIAANYQCRSPSSHRIEGQGCMLASPSSCSPSLLNFVAEARAAQHHRRENLVPSVITQVGWGYGSIDHFEENKDDHERSWKDQITHQDEGQDNASEASTIITYPGMREEG